MKGLAAGALYMESAYSRGRDFHFEAQSLGNFTHRHNWRIGGVAVPGGHGTGASESLKTRHAEERRGARRIEIRLLSNGIDRAFRLLRGTRAQGRVPLQGPAAARDPWTLART